MTLICWRHKLYSTIFYILTIPASVKVIDEEAFSGNGGIKGLKFENSSRLNTIGKSAFANDSGMISIEFPDSWSVTTISERAFYSCDHLAGTLDVPDTVETIATDAFRGTVIVGLNFSANSRLKTLGDHAFYTCNGLTTVTLPASLTTINAYLFSSGNTALKNGTGIRYRGTQAQYKAINIVSTGNDPVIVENQGDTTTKGGVTIVYGYTGQ